MRAALAVLAWLIAAPGFAQPAGGPFGPVSSGPTNGAPIPTMRSAGYTAFTTNPAGSNATIADTPVGITIASTNFGGTNINAACKPVPTPPYTITAHVTLTQEWAAGNSWAGLAWFDPSNTALVVTGPLAATDVTPHHPSIYSLIFSNPTTWSQTTIGGAYTYSPSAWVRYADDGVNWTISWSADGINFYRFFHNPKFPSYTQVCIFLSASGSDAAASFDTYSETSP
jgi:hypothetical protein